MFKLFKTIKTNIDTFIASTIADEDDIETSKKQKEPKNVKLYDLSEIFPFKVAIATEDLTVETYCRKGSIDAA